jgi:signal-transduction protein with cAMP-binding, CBS, and nucleotidyltransferase domain
MLRTMKLDQLATAPAVTCPPTRTITDVAREMRENEVGCVVVTDDGGHIIGIVTDRDLVVRAMAREQPGTTPVSDVMTHDVVQLSADADLGAACNVMAAWGTRRVPVVRADGTIQGLISHDDVTRALADAVDEVAASIRTRRPGHDPDLTKAV